ncbi:MAG: hypothetical protein NTZ83_06410, partial [Candidatus Pacearchaeota archaeon]|nr:hypothetical protein [Candidatus Pacearchaeota archaeon]
SKFVEIKKPNSFASFLLGNATINPGVLAAENRRFCSAGILECFKAIATSKELYILHPTVRENYRLQHPEFANPANYKNQAIETLDFMVRNPERLMIDDRYVRDLEKCKPLLTGLFDKAIEESISYASQQQSLKTGTGK